MANATIGAHVAGQEPASRWLPQVVRPEPSGAMVQLRSEAAREVLAACGVPVELFTQSDGTGAREAWRRFLYGTVRPLAAICAAELAAKLDAPGLSFSFEQLFASDLSGRSRSFASMVGGGLPVADAAQIAGLVED